VEQVKGLVADLRGRLDKTAVRAEVVRRIDEEIRHALDEVVALAAVPLVRLALALRSRDVVPEVAGRVELPSAPSC
jgi:hypothetical protein